MRIKEVTLNEGVFGSIAGLINNYRNQHAGSGALAASQKIFVKNFVQEYQQIMNSAKKGGIEQPDMKTYLVDYLNNQGWKFSPEMINKIVAGGGNDITKIANSVYTIAMRQRQGRMNAGKSAETPTGKQIVSALGSMTDKSHVTDLELVAKAAVNQLYKINPKEYAGLKDELLSGKKTGEIEADKEENPNIVRGMNESKTRKISNRHK